MKTLIFIAIAGLCAQLVDGGLGMGFGVTSTTILLFLAGLGPAQASAVVHTAEVGTTFVSGLSHWKFGNVDWKIVLKLGVPGAIAAFAGATFLSNIHTDAAAPITSAILVAVGLNLVLRFSRGKVRREGAKKTYSSPFLFILGGVGGFVDATGGGGWGPVTTSTLMGLGRQEPRRIVGTVNTAEFLVSLAATLGFVIGLWDDLLANFAAVIALLMGGMIAAPVAAWLISRVNAIILGGFVGTLIVALNITKVLVFIGVSIPFPTPLLILGIIVAGFALTARGYRISKARTFEAGVQKDREGTFDTATVVSR